MTHPTRRSFTTAAFAFALGALACVDRQTEPDYSEIIDDACASACPTRTECNPEPVYASVEECVEMCSSSESWDDLDECDTRRLELSFCVGDLTCAEYDTYLMWIESGTLELPQDYECVNQLGAWYACNSENPFEEPQR